MASWVKTDAIRDRTAEEDIRAGNGSEVQHYRVFFDGPDANAADAIYANGIPAKGERLGTTNCYVSKRSAKQDDNDPSIFIVEVTYSTYQANQQKPRPEGASKWNVECTGTSVPYTEEVHEDRDGNAIQNINDEPVQPPLTRTEYDEQVNVSFFTIAPDFPTMDICRGKTNDAAITLTLTSILITVTDPSTDPPTTTTTTQTVTRTFAPETLKLDATTWGMVYDSNGDKVVQVSLVFLYRKDTWAQNVPQLSYYKQDKNGTLDANGRVKLYPITERDIGGNTDQPVNQAQYIDGNGQPIAPGGEINTMSINIVKKTSFATLLSEIAQP